MRQACLRSGRAPIGSLFGHSVDPQASQIRRYDFLDFGRIDGVFIGDRDNYGDLNHALDELSKAHGVTPSGIAVAWIVRHPATFKWFSAQPTRVVSPKSAAGSDVVLTREEWYRLFRSAGHTFLEVVSRDTTSADVLPQGKRRK